MLAAALEAEVAAYIAAHADELDEQRPPAGGAQRPRGATSGADLGRRGARCGRRGSTTSASTRPPGERRRFASAILPAWCRKSPKITEVLPLLYLHGLSSKDFVPGAGGLPRHRRGPVRGDDHPADRAVAGRRPRASPTGICPRWTTCTCGPTASTSTSASTRRSCACSCSSACGSTARKELVALADGYRESTGSWADLLRDCKRRGMRAPVLAVGDGALGFWGALREVFPETREQRCWFHKIGNVLSALPKSAHPGAKKALAEIWNAEDRDHARRAAAAFKLAYGAKFGKAVAKITDDLDELLALLRLPGRTLDPPAHHQPDRVDLRHRPPPQQGHQGPRLEGRRPRHGVQAHRGRPGPLARGQRTPPRRPRPRRRRFNKGKLVERPTTTTTPRLLRTSPIRHRPRRPAAPASRR